MLGSSSSETAVWGWREVGGGEEIHVQRIVADFEYPVCFTRSAFAPDNSTLRDVLTRREPARRHRALFVVDRRVAAAWPGLCDDITAYAARHADVLQLAGPPLIVDGGEAAKNDADAPGRVLARIDEVGLDRQSFVVAVGGGALLDMVGYAAATAHRGLRLVRLPTTLLAQADSGVGVKNGINAFGKKNFLGVFAPPFAVVNDIALLSTLDAREVASGMAEAVKVALIRDAAFFAWIRTHLVTLAARDENAVATLVRRSARLHLDHIASSGDPFETGSARPLDFGHWAAHKLESLSNHRLRHGEAVALGMALDCVYSAEVGLLAPEALEIILGVLETLGLRLWDEALLQRGPGGRFRILDGISEFREHLGGELTVTLLHAAGHPFDVHELHDMVVVRAIDRLRRREAVRRTKT